MKQSITFIVFFFIYFSSYGHIEIFKLNDGSIKPNQLVERHYSVEIELHEKLYIDEIGIDYFNVGEDDIANIRIEIYNNNQLVFSKKTIINSVYNQVAYIKTNFLLIQHKSYVIQIIDEDLEKFNITDNILGLFTPKKLPSNEINNIFTTKSIGSSIKVHYPFSNSISCPFLHLGTTTQTGILFSEIENKNEYDKYSGSINKATLFKVFNTNNPIYLDSIGLNYIDSGFDNKSTLRFKLIDTITKAILWNLDTTIYNIHKSSIYFPVNVTLQNNIYLISIAMNNISNYDDNIILYKPTKLPYTDNLEKLTITSLLSKNEINEIYTPDTIGIPFIMSYRDELLKLNSKKEYNQHITSIDNRIIIRNNRYKEIYIYDLTGKSMFQQKNIEHLEEIEIETSTLQSGMYILKFINKEGHLIDYKLHKY
jgi:hypothetical protein